MSFDLAGEYSNHVAISNLLCIEPMTYAQWVGNNTPQQEVEKNICEKHDDELGV